jgi:hypothetical protein
MILSFKIERGFIDNKSAGFVIGFRCNFSKLSEIETIGNE